MRDSSNQSARPKDEKRGAFCTRCKPGQVIVVGDAQIRIESTSPETVDLSIRAPEWVRIKKV